MTPLFANKGVLAWGGYGTLRGQACWRVVRECRYVTCRRFLAGVSPIEAPSAHSTTGPEPDRAPFMWITSSTRSWTGLFPRSHLAGGDQDLAQPTRIPKYFKDLWPHVDPVLTPFGWEHGNGEKMRGRRGVARDQCSIGASVIARSWALTRCSQRSDRPVSTACVAMSITAGSVSGPRIRVTRSRR